MTMCVCTIYEVILRLSLSLSLSLCVFLLILRHLEPQVRETQKNSKFVDDAADVVCSLDIYR